MRRFRIAISVLMLAALLLVRHCAYTLASPLPRWDPYVTHDQTGKLTFIGIDTASVPVCQGHWQSSSRSAR